MKKQTFRDFQRKNRTQWASCFSEENNSRERRSFKIRTEVVPNCYKKTNDLFQELNEKKIAFLLQEINRSTEKPLVKIETLYDMMQSEHE